MKLIEAVLVLILTDTSVGVCVQLKNHSLQSSIGRQRLTQKVAELIVLVALNVLTGLDNVHFNQDYVQMFYLIFAAFEVVSILENLNALGLISDKTIDILRIDNSRKKDNTSDKK